MNNFLLIILSSILVCCCNFQRGIAFSLGSYNSNNINNNNRRHFRPTKTSPKIGHRSTTHYYSVPPTQEETTTTTTTTTTEAATDVATKLRRQAEQIRLEAQKLDLALTTQKIDTIEQRYAAPEKEYIFCFVSFCLLSSVWKILWKLSYVGKEIGKEGTVLIDWFVVQPFSMILFFVVAGYHRLNNKSWLAKHPEEAANLKSQLKLLNDRLLGNTNDAYDDGSGSGKATSTSTSTTSSSSRFFPSTLPTTTASQVQEAEEVELTTTITKNDSEPSTTTTTKTTTTSSLTSDNNRNSKKKNKKEFPQNPIAGFDESDLVLYLPVGAYYCICLCIVGGLFIFCRCEFLLIPMICFLLTFYIYLVHFLSFFMQQYVYFSSSCSSSPRSRTSNVHYTITTSGTTTTTNKKLQTKQPRRSMSVFRMQH